MLQAYFGSSEYHWLSEVSVHLSPQKVIIISWSSYLSHRVVNVLCCQVIILTINCIVCLTVDILEESFQMASGMFGTGAFKSVRE